MNKLSLKKSPNHLSLDRGKFSEGYGEKTGVAFNTVLKLVPQIGKACAAY